MIVHGLIHLLGFVKEWKLARVDQLSGATLFPLSEGTARVLGAVWLAAFLAFGLSAAGLVMGKEWWWMAAAGAVLISQVLIVIYWKDARAGTVVNLIILPVIVVSWAGWSFDRMVQQEVRTLFASSTGDGKQVVTQSMLEEFPPAVQRWLERSNVVGREEIRTARLKQHGTMRTSPDGSWMPFEAEQHVTVYSPAFIWKARIEAAPLVHIVGRDSYVGGRGNMLIKILSLVTIADSRGPEMDQGALLRYLAEAVWYPTSALNSYIRWESIDSTSARATMSYGGVTASGVFTFDEKGDLLTFEAQRYGEFDGTYSLETWSIATKGHREFGGVRIPNVSEVTWKLKAGDYTWLRLEITELEYDRPEVE